MRVFSVYLAGTQKKIIKNWHQKAENKEKEDWSYQFEADTESDQYY